jgi:asparaginyl-tRNA synthetase
LRDLSHLRPRSNIIGCISRIRSNLAFAVHLFFQNLDFLYINTPIITKCNCEPDDEQFTVTTLLEKNYSKKNNKSNNTTMFDLETKNKNYPFKIIQQNYNENHPKNLESISYFKNDFFEDQVYLTSSGQLELESYACALSDVYSFGPAFRAEYNFTERHLAEFWMVECEICFADLSDIMSLSEKFIKFCLNYTLEHNKADLNYIANHYEKNVFEIIKNACFPYLRVNYTEVIDILLEASNFKKNFFKESVTWGISLSQEHELYLTDVYFKSPVFIYNYPKRVKSFYMKINDDQETVSAMDLLVPRIGEILGGSEREDRLNILSDNVKREFGINSEKYKSYLELRKFGTVPHSGFGLGFDRLVMLATGIKNIKDVIPYPRYPDYSEF